MLRVKRNILILALALAAASTAVVGQATQPGTPLARPPRGSVAAQLQFKLKLIRAGSGQTLASSIGHNRKEWESLSPDQRDRYRMEYLAFLKESPDRQQRVIEKFGKLIRMDAKRQAAYRSRAHWLKAVVKNLTADERLRLKDLTPQDRAKALLEMRDRLVREGKLKLQPTTTSAPATTRLGSPQAQPAK